MDSKQLFAKALQQASSCIRHIRPEQYKNPTPCREWDLHALLNHMVYELLWMPEIIRGKTVAEVGSRFDGDVLRTDPHAAWQHAADSALVAVNHADPESVAHLSYGDKPVMDYIVEVGGDIFIHTWDVGQAMQCTVLLDEAIIQTVYDAMLPHKDDLVKSGAYAPALEVSDDAPLQDKLLALTGRSPKWQTN